MKVESNIEAVVSRSNPITPITSKWGDAVAAGFTTVPNALIKYQSQLGITQNEMAVILNLIIHWWYRDKLPFPTTRNISKRSGLALRTVQRALKSLVAKGFIQKINQEDKIVYDFEGLRLQLERYAKNDPWFIKENP